MPLPALVDVAGLPLVGHHARLTPLYANDFAAPFMQGRSQGPRGEGSHVADADSMVPFHYRVVVDHGHDGLRAARFPTMREQPGGGNFYSWFAAYVSCRHGLAEGDRLYAWTVHLPKKLQLDARCSYYENRHVFALGVEDKENHLGLRFDGDRALVWCRGLNEREELLGRITLRRTLVPGDVLVLYSDGVTEAENPDGVPYEERGLVQTVEAAPNATAPDIGGAILREVAAHAREQRFADDLTILVLRVLPPLPSVS